MQMRDAGVGRRRRARAGGSAPGVARRSGEECLAGQRHRLSQQGGEEEDAVLSPMPREIQYLNP